MKSKLDIWSPQNSFESLKRELLKVDPVSFAESYINLEGSKFRITNNGWKFIADIYRHIITVGMSNKGKPIVIVKGRQVGATIMATALELYMVTSGLEKLLL
jgi:hypothetical protein